MAKNPKHSFSVSSQKDPISNSSPSSFKTPKHINYNDSDSLNPAWRVSNLETVDPFGWHKITDQETMNVIREKLKGFESMTWHEILIKAKKQNHSIQREKLCPDAQKRLRALNLDDQDDFVSLRVTGEQRIWGIKQHNVLLLLWWDPGHKICPCNKD